MGITEAWNYVVERFPLQVTLPLSGILAAGMPRPETLLLVKCATVALVLFCLRVGDDVADLERDRCLAPKRCLPSGKVRARILLWWSALAAGAAVVANLGNRSWPFVLAALAAYACFFALRKKVALFVKPFLSNLIFCLLPLYGEMASTGHVSRASLLSGLFLWTSAVGHEFAHSAADPGSGHPVFARYTDFVSPRTLLGVAMLFFLAGAWALMSGHDREGGLLVGAWLGIITLLCGWAIVQPRQGRAMYIGGFSFVLVPLGMHFSN